MTEENPAAESERPEEAEGPSTADSTEEKAEASGETETAEEAPEDSEEEKEPSSAPVSEEGAEASAEAEAAEETPEEPEEDPIESLQGVQAVRALLGDEVEEVTSFTGKPDEVSMVVPAGRVRELCEHLKTQHGFNYLSDLCGVHYAERDRPFEVVYQLFALDRSERLRLKVRVGDGEAVPSVTGVWAGADWFEREAYDMFGIEFEGHPDLRRILLPEDWEGFPLRKEYPIRGDGFGLTWVERQIPSVSRPVRERK